MQIKINDDLHFFQCEYQVFGEALENIFFFHVLCEQRQWRVTKKDHVPDWSQFVKVNDRLDLY